MTALGFGLRLRNRMPRLGGIALLCAIALGGGACTTPQQRVEQKEDSLSAAGFVVRTANTPERIAMLNRLPAHRFVQRTHGSTVSYVYADPLVCNCLYVGTQDAYGRYRQYMQQQRLADERRLTAQMYSDASWNWSAWGPWGPAYGFGPDYGFDAFGPGW